MKLKIRKNLALIDQHDKNFMYGGKFGGNFIPETLKSEKNLIGTIQSVKILKINRNTLFGELISNFNQKNCAA